MAPDERSRVVPRTENATWDRRLAANSIGNSALLPHREIRNRLGPRDFRELSLQAGNVCGFPVR
jgi:hypothetical protein